MLKNATYIGTVIGHTTTTINYKTRTRKRVPKDEWIMIPNMHEPIISQEQFELVQKILKEHGTVRKRKHDNIFKGMVKCGHCKSNMTIKPDARYKDDDTKISFICSHKNQIRTNCDNPTIKARILEEIVLGNLREECKKIVFDKKELEETFATAETEINTKKYEIKEKINKIEKKIEKVETQIKAIYQDKLDGILLVDDFLTIYKAKNEEKDNLISSKKELEQQLGESEKAKVVDYEELKQFANNFLKMQKPTKETTKNLIEEIVVSKGRNVKIKYKFSKV